MKVVEHGSNDPALASIRCCIVGMALALAMVPPVHSRDWNTVSIGGRDYVAVAEVVKAFEMKQVRRSAEKEIGFAGSDRILAVKLDSRQAIINGTRTWWSFPVLKDERGRPSLSLLDIRTTLAPAFDPGSVELDPVRTIVFDPGHGGHDRGGKSVYGNEKDYVLDIVGRARRILEKRGFKVVQSRLGDSFVNLGERPVMTKNYEAPIFLSIHLNSAGWRPAASGIEIFALPPSGAPPTGGESKLKADIRPSNGQAYEPQSVVLANTIYQTLAGKMDAVDRGVKRARFAVLRHAKVPAVLIEGGFLTNPEEARRIHDPEWREGFATALADGIEAYCDFANRKVEPPSAQELGRSPTDEFFPE